MRGRDGRAVGDARARAGFTLIELLLVMLILGLVLGTGVGMFAALDLGRRQADGTVRDVLRSAHNAAIAQAAPARVFLDEETGTLRAEALEVIGTWHFEGPEPEGAFGLDGLLYGAEPIEDGFLGRALCFRRPTSAGAGGAAPHAEIPLAGHPDFALREGFRVDVAARLEGVGGGSLLALGGSVGIVVDRGGIVRAWLAREEPDAAGAPVRGALVTLDSAPGALPPGRWVRLRFEYDRLRARLLVDGELAAETAETAPVWPVEGPLVLSHRSRPFPGSLDALVIAAVTSDEEARLPASVRFAPDTVDEVRFDAGGALDRAYNDGAVEIVLVHADGAQQRVRVQPYGTVE